MEKSALTLCLMVFNPPPSNPSLFEFLSYGLKSILRSNSVRCPVNRYNFSLQKLYITHNILKVKSIATIKVDFF